MNILASNAAPEPVAVPNRTPLLPVHPIGIGTSSAESINSYMLRLAAYNDSHPSSLYGKVSAAAPEWRRAIPYVFPDIFVYLTTSATGRTLTSVLAEHTGVSEVSRLSWHDPACCVDVKGFFDRPLKWCPECLAEDETPYRRILWQLRPVTVCAKHRVRLLSRCPRCDAPVAQLGQFHGVQECFRCRTPLSAFPADKRVPATEPEIYVAQEGANLVAAASSQTLDWARIAPLQPLMHIATLQRATGVTRAAAVLGIEHATLIGWRAGKNTSLVHVFNACCFNGLPVLPVLRGELCAAGSHRAPRPPPRPRTRAKADSIRAAVLALQAANKGKPLSITEMARELHVHRERIKEVCPELQGESRAAIAKYWAAQRAEFERDLKQRVDNVIDEMKRGGEPMLRYRLLKRFTRNERCLLIEFSDYVLSALRAAEAAMGSAAN